MSNKFAVVSTIDDSESPFVREFPDEDSAFTFAAKYARDDGRTGSELDGLSDREAVEKFQDWLGASEWLFVFPLEKGYQS